MEPNTDCWMVVHFGGEHFGRAAILLQWSGLDAEVLAYGHDLEQHDMTERQWPPHSEDEPRDGLWLWEGSTEWQVVEDEIGTHEELLYTGTWSRLNPLQLSWLADGRCVA